jgi:hypothetical protein
MRKLLLFFAFISLVLVGGYYYYLPIVRWQNAVESAGPYPYKIGLLKTTQIQCVTSCDGACCSGGTLCTVKEPGICATYSEISGSQAGGMGTMALFSLTQTSMAGYKPGDSIIAGGMTMTEMDNGVLGAPGGCSGCAMGDTDSNLFDRIAAIVKYIIAGKKE